MTYDIEKTVWRMLGLAIATGWPGTGNVAGCRVDISFRKLTRFKYVWN